MLELIMFPCDNPFDHDPQKAARSVAASGVVSRVTMLKNRRLDLHETSDLWFGYIYSDEYLDEELQKALPIFMESGMYDVLILMQRIPVPDGGYRYSQSPRIFRQGIQIAEGMHVPASTSGLRVERVLNGWIERAA